MMTAIENDKLTIPVSSPHQAHVAAVNSVGVGALSRSAAEGCGQGPATDTPHIHVPARHNRTLAVLMERINADAELKALWRCANVNAVERLGMSDHGWVHVQIVANIGLKILRLLEAAGVQPSIVRHHGLSAADAEVVVVLAALLHDVGMSIHRDDHERFSLFVAAPKLGDILSGLYDADRATVIRSEVLHAIIAHRCEQRPLTVEAGVVRVADALDMTAGRSRVPFEAGHVNIHSLSAAAIERVEIGAGEMKPVRVTITMSNSAGIFQVDEMLKSKLRNSGIAEHLEVVANLHGGQEKRLLEHLRL